MRKIRFAAFAVAVMVSGLGAPDASAGQIPLPTTYDQLEPAGNFAVVGPLTFSNFSYSVSPPGTFPSAADINVLEFNAGVEHGLQFRSGFFAAANTTVDYQISYLVTAAPGTSIIDALLSATYNIPTDSTGLVSIGETLINAATAETIVHLSISSNSLPSFDIANFAGVTSILVQKDILIVGGNLGAGVSFINQGYSYGGVPEPTSVLLMGLGLAGLASRRLLSKRASAPAA